jgi:SWIM/SEC-C metal-binding protein
MDVTLPHFRLMEVGVAKLGSHKRPAIVRVRSEEEAQEIIELAQQRGWQVIVGIEPDTFEDLSDLEKLMRADVKPEIKPVLPPRVSGNDYCPCRSGKKYKKCCGATIANPAGAAST